MDYFPQNTRSGNYENWVINYHGHYKVLTDKDSGIKYLLSQFSTEPMEYAYEDNHLVP